MMSVSECKCRCSSLRDCVEESFVNLHNYCMRAFGYLKFDGVKDRPSIFPPKTLSLACYEETIAFRHIDYLLSVGRIATAFVFYKITAIKMACLYFLVGGDPDSFQFLTLDTNVKKNEDVLNLNEFYLETSETRFIVLPGLGYDNRPGFRKKDEMIYVVTFPFQHIQDVYSLCNYQNYMRECDYTKPMFNYSFFVWTPCATDWLGPLASSKNPAISFDTTFQPMPCAENVIYRPNMVKRMCTYITTKTFKETRDALKVCFVVSVMVINTCISLGKQTCSRKRERRVEERK